MWLIAVPVGCLVAGLGVAVRDEVKMRGNVPANYRFGFYFTLVVISLATAFIAMVTRG